MASAQLESRMCSLVLYMNVDDNCQFNTSSRVWQDRCKVQWYSHHDISISKKYKLSPRGRNPNTENSARWKTGGSHYKIAIRRLGSWVPKQRTLVGMYEHMCHSTKHQMKYYNTKYILTNKTHNNPKKTKQLCQKQHACAYSRSIYCDTVSRNITIATSYGQADTVSTQNLNLQSEQHYKVPTFRRQSCAHRLQQNVTV